MRQVTRDPAWRFYGALAIAIIGTLSILLWVSSAWGAGHNDATPGYQPVTLCHATHASTNPYVIITVDDSGAWDGHAGHTGPVFDPLGGQHQTAWGDIIPPFQYGDQVFPGLNLSPEGSAILGNGCVPVTPPCETDCGPPPCTEDCGPPPCTEDCGPPPCTTDCGPPPCETDDCGPVIPPVVHHHHPQVPPSPTVKQYQQDVQNGAEPGGG